MIPLKAGHKYSLKNLKDKGDTLLTFYCDPKINGVRYKGPSTQEVLRACIDRVKFLEGQVSAPENIDILFHLRSAIILFEYRALRRRVEKGDEIETITTNKDGHIFNVA